jgi:hypothetical protein
MYNGAMKIYDIKCIWDTEASVWVAVNDDIPIALESESLDKLIDRVRQAAPELLSLNGKHGPANLRFYTDSFLEAV